MLFGLFMDHCLNLHTYVHLIVYRRSVAWIRHFVKENLECNNDVSIKLISKSTEGNKILWKCFMAMHSSFSSLVYVFCKMQFLLIAKLLKMAKLCIYLICNSTNYRIIETTSNTNRILNYWLLVFWYKIFT